MTYLNFCYCALGMYLTGLFFTKTIQITGPNLIILAFLTIGLIGATIELEHNKRRK